MVAIVENKTCMKEKVDDETVARCANISEPCLGKI